MKSSKEDLKKRGYLIEAELNCYTNLSVEGAIKLLQSEKAYERTAAVRMLFFKLSLPEPELSDILLKALINERSLYTKIEICNTLEKLSKHVIKNMIDYLGKIGNNQYHALPDAVSRKVSYPLPRDIIARTLGKMKVENLPILMDALVKIDNCAVREAIDAIGYMCFYNEISNVGQIIKNLIQCYEINKTDEIIRWKIVMTFSAFNDNNIICFLKTIIDTDCVLIIKDEAKRSLSIINRRRVLIEHFIS